MNPPAIPPIPQRLIVPGPKILLLGGSGAGKTHSLRTIIESGLKLYNIGTDPGAMETLLDDRFKVYSCEEGLHWRYIPPLMPGFNEIHRVSQLINQLSFKALSELGDVNKGQYRQFLQVVASLQMTRCDRCGKTFGPVEELGEDWAVSVDTLTGLNIQAMSLVVGGKPTAAKSDWGVAMNNLEKFIIQFCGGLQCMGVITGHLEREADEVTGAIQNMASTLGQKLAPKIPRFFSDVIHARRESTNYYWSTVTNNTDLKSRHLPLGDKHLPTFKPMIDAWFRKLQAARGAQAEIKAVPSVVSSTAVK